MTISLSDLVNKIRNKIQRSQVLSWIHKRYRWFNRIQMFMVQWDLLRKVWWKLKRFFDTKTFSDHDVNQFILLLWKGVQEKFNESSLPEKEDFYSPLNMEDIIDSGCTQAKSVCKNFEMKNLGEYHDLYVQSDTFLLAYVFDSVMYFKICLEICELHPSRFLTTPGLAALKKIKVNLDLLTDMKLSLMVEKVIRWNMSCY